MNNRYVIGFVAVLVVGLVVGAAVGQVGDLDDQVRALTSETGQLQAQLSTQGDEIEGLNALIAQLQVQIGSERAYGLLRMTLARPGEQLAEAIVYEFFEELRDTSDKFQLWVIALGEQVVIDALAPVINSKFPALVWNDHSVSHLSGSVYAASAITYFPIEIDTGSPLIGVIAIARVALVVTGNVDVNASTVTALQVTSIELVAG